MSETTGTTGTGEATTVPGQDGAPLEVLFIGGTGTISASCVRLSVASGMRVHLLNRGRNSAGRSLPAGVQHLVGDVTDAASLRAALGDRTFDSVVDFLSYDTADAERAVDTFTDRTRQYIHISSASVYGKPVLKSPITESTPVHNRFLEYARAKLRAERTLLDAYARSGFPVTVVRPAHTYDDANPPLPGGWTTVDRIARGDTIAVHGDGTSLWTLTHAEDFAQGLIGLLADPRAIGETFHITGDDVLTWDQIYTLVGVAVGRPARLVHVPSELFPVVAPDWFWSDLMVGDLGHSAVFDTSKIRRFVPAFSPRLTFHRAVRRMADWRAAHPGLTAPDPDTDAILARIADAAVAARSTFADRAPQPVAVAAGAPDGHP